MAGRTGVPAARKNGSTMGLTLFCSHRLEALSAALAEQLRTSAASPADAEAALFEPTTIVAPNQNIRKWLQLQIARQNGIAIHLQFQFLEEEFWAWLSERSGKNADSPEPLEKHTLPWLVLAALLGAAPSEHESRTASAAQGVDALEPLRGYVFRGTGEARSGAGVVSRQRAAKAWQLAERLAGLLRDYEFHRPDWIVYWRDATRPRPRDLPDTPLAIAEGELYRRLFLPGGLCDSLGRVRGRRLSTLPQWALELLPESVGSKEGPHGPTTVSATTSGQIRQPLHIFSFPQVSQFHRRLLFRLAAERPVCLYLLNLGGIPSVDFPAAASTPWFPPATARKIVTDAAGEWLVPAGSDLDSAPDGLTALVRGWGRVGAEGLHLIACETLSEPLRGRTNVQWLGSGATSEISPSATSSTLLSGLQAWLLGDSPAPLPLLKPPELDESLALALCPSVQREVEAVYNAILRNLSTQPGLMQTEILVLVPSMEKYRPAIHAVFDRGEAGLGYNLGDVSGAGDSLYAQGVQAALALAEGRFTRAEVFEFLRNPCVHAALGVNGKRLTQWSRWADALHVFAEDAPIAETEKGMAGGQPVADRGLFGWRRALTRLQLGRVMAAPSPVIEIDDTIPADYAGLIPYADSETGETSELDAFVHTLELLDDAVRRVRAAGNDGERWRRELFALLVRFLRVPEEHPEEQAVQALVAGLFERLAETLRVTQAGALFGGPHTPAALVREALLQGLQEIPSRQGRYLSGGVTVSTQFPQRPIPFRVIFMLGLDESSFPGATLREVIDLRRDRRRLGDVDAIDLERFMF
ncbi:MAG TPA: exodeoxyribonuclease V subunit gamma, partial [Planctomycetota bacterium]|nr:exodeoxyribonuclease V subunit gamma [Planctomycetota bacterium]